MASNVPAIPTKAHMTVTECQPMLSDIFDIPYVDIAAPTYDAKLSNPE